MNMRLWSISLISVGIGVCLCVVVPQWPAFGQSPASVESAQSQEAGGEPESAPNCRAEMETLCKGIQPGGGRLKKCFDENHDKLSPACQQQIQERKSRMKQGMQEFKTACEADVKQFCPNIQRGGGRVLQCLEEHSRELSGPCAQALEKRPAKKER